VSSSSRQHIISTSLPTPRTTSLKYASRCFSASVVGTETERLDEEEEEEEEEEDDDDDDDGTEQMDCTCAAQIDACVR
jgi:hypothetical protein